MESWNVVDTLMNMEVYIISLTILGVILFRILKDDDKKGVQSRLFLMMLVFTMIELSLEALGWCLDGKMGCMARMLGMTTDVLLFVLNPVPLLLWIMYLDIQVFGNEGRLKKVLLPLGAIFLFNLALSVTAPINGQMFYLDGHNLYHRGPWYYGMESIYYGCFIYSLIVILWHRRHIPREYFTPLLAFLIPPFIGAVLQMTFYGISLIWSSVSISILIVYISIQSRIVGTDYMTGLSNRRQLNRYLQNKIRSLQTDAFLGALLIDIDGFKQINDTFGHKIGDRAIEITAMQLLKCFQNNAFIARYGGDEFVVLLNLAGDSDLETVIFDLRQHFEEYNKHSRESFEINISVGGRIFGQESNLTTEIILDEIDRLMYREKKRKKSAEASETAMFIGKR
jgi:diguanylate cyclase (GGDEF)-like protein